MARVRIRNTKRTHWTKGDACESNPKSRVYRSKVDWKKLAQNKSALLMPPTITEESSKPQPVDNKNNLLDCSQSIGVMSTYSTRTFGHILKTLKITDSFSQEMLAILNSVVKITEDNIENPTDSDYFCSIVSLLNPPQQMRDVVASIICLLSAVIMKVNNALIVKTTPNLLPHFLYIMDNIDLYRDCCENFFTSLTVILQNLNKEVIQTHSSIIEQIYIKYLALLSHQNEDIIILTNKSIKQLLHQCDNNEDALSYLLHHTVKHIRIFLNTATTYPTMNSTQQLAPNTLNFLSEISMLLPDKKAAIIFDATMKYSIFCDKKTRAHLLDCWKRILTSPLKLSVKYVSLMEQLYAIVNDSWIDSTKNIEIISTNVLVAELVSHVVTFIYKLDNVNGIKFVKNYMETYIQRLTQQHNVVAPYKKIIQFIKNVICFNFIDDSYHEKIVIDDRKNALIDTYKILTDTLTTFEGSIFYGNFLDLLQAYINYFGPNYANFLNISVAQLLSHYDGCLSSKTPHADTEHIKQKLLSTLSTLVGVIGPEKFLSQINISSYPQIYWLFQFIKENIQYNVHVSFFVQHIKPYLHQISSSGGGSLLSNQNAATNDLIIFHGWDMLSSFCLYGDDINEVKPLANILVHMLQDSDDIYYASVFRCLRCIVQNKLDINGNKDLEFFSKKFLPILFNIYTNELKVATNNQCLPTYLMDGSLLETIRSLLHATNFDLIVSFFDKAVEKVTVLCGSRLTHLLDIIAEFSLYIPATRMNTLFSKIVFVYFDQVQVKPMDTKLLKKILHIVENVIKNASKNNHTLIIDTYHDKIINIIDTTSRISTNNSVQSAKLGCIEAYLELIPASKPYIVKYLPEIILSFGNTSGKCRVRATHILVKMTNILSSASFTSSINDVVEVFVKFMLQGLDGTLEANLASIRALLFYIKLFKANITTNLQLHILSSVFSRVNFNEEKPLIKPLLNFIKISIKAFHVKHTEYFLQTMLNHIFNMDQSLRAKFIRDIRIILERLLNKLNFERVNSAIPQQHKKLLTAVFKEMKAHKLPTIEKSRTPAKDNEQFKFDSNTGKIIIGKSHNEKCPDDSSDDDTSDDNQPICMFNRKNSNQLKASKRSVVNDGLKYKAKKAQGDVKLRGKPDPYAYIPLNMQVLNKRKAAKLKGQFDNIVRVVNKNKRY